jgi:hypothetical protein
MRKTVQRKDHATGMGFLILLAIITAPVWLVIAAGLALPLLIAAAIGILPIAVVRSWFRG